MHLKEVSQWAARFRPELPTTAEIREAIGIANIARTGVGLGTRQTP